MIYVGVTVCHAVFEDSASFLEALQQSSPALMNKMPRREHSDYPKWGSAALGARSFLRLLSKRLY